VPEQPLKKSKHPEQLLNNKIKQLTIYLLKGKNLTIKDVS
jgi:hypothetical protein